MGVEITRLECIREISALEAEPILERAFESEREEESIAPQLDDDVSELFLVEDGVIIDSDPFATESWAAALSKESGDKAAISITAYADFDAFSIHRYASGKLTGKLEVDERTKREKNGSLRIKVPFLSNLIASKPKPALAKGMKVMGNSAHEMVLMIARAAGLPTPRDKYQGEPTNAARCVRVRNRSAQEREERARSMREEREEREEPDVVMAVRTVAASPPPLDDRPITRPDAWQTGPTVGELTAIEGRDAAAGESDILVDTQRDLTPASEPRGQPNRVRAKSKKKSRR
jgi:hypothetical protein